MERAGRKEISEKERNYRQRKGNGLKQKLYSKDISSDVMSLVWKRKTIIRITQERKETEKIINDGKKQIKKEENL